MRWILTLGFVVVLPDVAVTQAAAAVLPPVQVGPHTFHRRVLENGLRAVAVRDAGEKASVFVVVSAGKRHETVATTGLAHLTEHAMYAGTKKTRLGEHDRRIRAIGGESNAFTREDYTLFYDHDFPQKHLVEVLQMEADRLRGLTFEEKAVLYERERLRREELSTFKPTDNLQQRLEAAVFRVHPYGAGVFDAKGNSKAPQLGVDVVRKFYDRYYHPDHTAVVVVGDLPPKKMLAMIDGAFGGLPRGPARAPVPTEPAIEEPRVARVPAELSRPRRSLVWLIPPMGHADRPALAAFARVLSQRGGGDDAPISAEMGERVDQDLFTVTATGDAAADLLAEVLAGIRKGAVTTAELAEVQKLLADDYSTLPLRARPYFSLAGTFGVFEVLGHAAVPRDHGKRIRELSVAGVQAAVQRWLRPEACVTVVFGVAADAGGVGSEKPLPTDLRELAKAASAAEKAGDLDRAIEAYSRLLKAGPNRMFQVIYLSSRGQIRVKKKDYDGAIQDYEAALQVIDYPAVRDLLKEAKALRASKKKGG